SVHSVTYLSGSDTGILSPHSDGERDALIGSFANHQGRKKVPRIASHLLPVTMREKVPVGG
ncbi:MAG: hypothetical protein EOS27_21855, partial [Mesorhizobium sp.]